MAKKGETVLSGDGVEKKSSRILYVIRHGERVDFTFGGNWMEQAFPDGKSYSRYNLNMPVRMPQRSGWPQDFRMDTPLTECGLHQARLTGEALREEGVTLSHVFCSPALRCIQTCNSLLGGLHQQHLPIKVETGLFEWTGWFQPSLPEWMSLEELRAFGFNVDGEYSEIVSKARMDMSESIQQYYERNHRVADTIQKWLKPSGGNILLVAHGASLDTCTRLLCDHEPRSTPDFYRILHQVAYCAVGCAREEEEGGGWKIIQPPVPCLSHSANHGLDWRQLL